MPISNNDETGFLTPNAEATDEILPKESNSNLFFVYIFLFNLFWNDSKKFELNFFDKTLVKNLFPKSLTIGLDMLILYMDFWDF